MTGGIACVKNSCDIDAGTTYDMDGGIIIDGIGVCIGIGFGIDIGVCIGIGFGIDIGVCIGIGVGIEIGIGIGDS